MQRIGVTTLVATSALVSLRVRGQTIIVAALLLGYWALLGWLAVPGISVGVSQPGYDLTAFVDRAVFGTSHLLHGTWDPEGLLSTLPAVATVLLGAFAGQWLQSDRGAIQRTVAMLTAGVAGILIGALWSQAFPLNKNLWTSSFVMLTAGIAAVLLAICYWLVDVKGYDRWAQPFVILSVNAITVYVFSEVMDTIIDNISIEALGIHSLRKALFKYVFASWLSPYTASLAFACGYALACIGAMAVLYRSNVRITL